MSATANWNYPTSIRFGAGRIAELPTACRELGIARPLLVTDAGLAALPMTAELQRRLDDAGLEVAIFSDVRPNPVGANLDAGLAAYRAGRHDGVIAFGGGSGLDMGKLIAFMSGQQQPVWAFEDIGDAWTRADPAGIAPVIAVPTTAGTGSEVGRCGVLVDSEARCKKIIFHPQMLPRLVLCDPQLTLALPPAITAGTGMDALAHCIEAYCAPGFHPLADGIAVEGIRLIASALPRVMNDPQDIDARGDMLAAALMGATAFQKGLGAMHALAHPLGARHDTHHGMTNAVLMPYVLAFNRDAIEARIARLAAWLQLPEPGFDGFLAFVLQLRVEGGVSPKIVALGIDASEADSIAALAVTDPSAAGNPVPLDIDGARRLFLAACSSDLSAVSRASAAGF
jgi:alcohol dehydrogenase class IV